jgi:hypothetical protein
MSAPPIYFAVDICLICCAWACIKARKGKSSEKGRMRENERKSEKKREK